MILFGDMKIKNYIWIVGAWFCLHGQWALADQPMEYSDKLSELKSLEQYQQNNGFSARQKTSQELSECSPPYSDSCKELLRQDVKKERLEEKYKKGDMLAVRVYFKADKEFPLKYVGGSPFREEVSLSEETKKLIYINYLGDDFEAFYPELHISLKERVGITLFVYSSDQLLNVIGDERIIKMRHIANHSEPEEVLL